MRSLQSMFIIPFFWTCGQGRKFDTFFVIVDNTANLILKKVTMNSLAGRVEYHPELTPDGLARGELKVDSSIVLVDAGSPITGEERIPRSTLHHGIGVTALEIHDRLVASGEIQPSPTVRGHILRVIGEAAHPWDKEE